MKQTIIRICYGVALVLCVLFGYWLHKVPPVPTSTTVVAIPQKPQHDTIPGKAVLVYREAKPRPLVHDTIPRIDTVYVPQVERVDSATCWSWEKAYPRGAEIKAKVCSDSLPTHAPLDAVFTIDYKPPADSVKIVTKSVEYKPTAWENLRNYGSLGVVCVAAGTVLGVWIQSQIK
jgi:hypothetical protein